MNIKEFDPAIYPIKVCDIYLRLEIKPKKDIKATLTGGKTILLKTKDKWYNAFCFSYNRCWSVRAYGLHKMFAKLANVGFYELRGFPKDANKDTFSLYCLEVITDEKYDLYCKDNSKLSTEYCSESNAANWISSDRSKEMKLGDDENIPYYKGKRFISNPAFHSPNWCTTQEMENCINEIFKNKNGEYKGDYIEWVALLGLMKGYESTGEYECRAVYWFNNQNYKNHGNDKSKR